MLVAASAVTNAHLHCAHLHTSIAVTVIAAVTGTAVLAVQMQPVPPLVHGAACPPGVAANSAVAAPALLAPECRSRAGDRATVVKRRLAEMVTADASAGMMSLLMSDLLHVANSVSHFGITIVVAQ
jgi:hypothetical protein